MSGRLPFCHLSQLPGQQGFKQWSASTGRDFIYYSLSALRNAFWCGGWQVWTGGGTFERGEQVDCWPYGIRPGSQESSSWRGVEAAEPETQQAAPQHSNGKFEPPQM
jgi:hypothetical protein